MWKVFREATQRCSFYVLSHSSKPIPQSFIFLQTEARVFIGPARSELGTGAAIAPGMIIMVKAVATAWLLTPGSPKTIGGNKRWGKGA